MGNTCIHAADSVVHLISEDEIKEAVRSVEEWQRQQAAGMKTGGQGQNHHGPLLQRVGGPDVVKKVVELFYKKLYADPRLILFLHDQNVVHLRAKQSAFISWLFGPPNVPYLGRSVRIAHLRIIKQRGFSGEDFDLGMKYFEQAMAEFGAPEVIMGEVMRRVRPFKDAFFTPSPKDAEEEARWVLEERAEAEAEAEAARQAAAAAEEEQAYHARERKLQEQITLAHRVTQAELEAEAEAAEEGDAAEWAADAAVMAAVATSRAASRPPSRSPHCPFKGSRMSRAGTASASGVDTARAGEEGLVEPQRGGSPKPRTPPTPTAGPSTASPTVASGGAVALRASTSTSSLKLGCGKPVAPEVGVAAASRPASQAAPRPGSGSGAGTAGGVAATAAAATAVEAAGRVPSPTATSPGTPPLDRPGTAAPVAQMAPSVAPPPSVPPPTAPVAPPPSVPPPPAPVAAAADPLSEFEAELDAIERAYSPAGGKGSGPSAPLLPTRPRESSSANARRTAAVC